MPGLPLLADVANKPVMLWSEIATGQGIANHLGFTFKGVGLALKTLVSGSKAQ